MSGHGEKLTRKQEAAIAALLEKPTIRKAAEAAGIAEATLRRWLRDAGFLSAYRQARRQVVEAVIGRLQRASSRAVATLVRNLRCGNPSVEVRAAATILEQAVKGVELTDLVEEVETLKKLFAEGEDKKP